MFRLDLVNIFFLFIAIRVLSFLDRIIRTKLIKQLILLIEVASVLFFLRERIIIFFIAFELFLIPTILLIVYYGRSIERVIA